MAATFTESTTIPNDVWGQTQVRFVTMKPAANDYATGGYPLTPGVGISLRIIYFVVPVGGEFGYVPVFNPATGNIEIFQQSAATGQLTQVPAATDLSALTFSFMLLGN